MTEMSSSGKFVPKEHEVDYDLEPCYKHYGLKHGQLSRYSDDLENETFRTAIQVRIDTVDFVRKYGDQLKIRMSGLEFLSLVNQWAKIQEHSKKHKGKFAPYYISDDGKFSIEHKTIGTNSHNIMYMTARRKMSLPLSDAEITCNSQDELRVIYDEWVKVNNADPSTLKPINIELGKGNSKCIESTGSAVHNPFRYNAEVNKNPNAVSYLPEHVMKQNMGLEQQEEDLMSQDLLFDPDDDQLIIDTARQQQNDFTPGQQVRGKKRRVVVQPDPEQEEPGVVEESQEDMVSRYFQTPQGKMNINKYGKAKAAKKAKNLSNIM